MILIFPIFKRLAAFGLALSWNALFLVRSSPCLPRADVASLCNIFLLLRKGLFWKDCVGIRNGRKLTLSSCVLSCWSQKRHGLKGVTCCELLGFH